MNIEIDPYLLINYKISAQQYIILFMVNKKNFDLLNSYLNSIEFSGFESDVLFLINQGYLKRFDYSSPLDIRGYSVLPKSSELLSNQITDYFDEFLQEFPDKVMLNGVTRYLKSDVTRCRTKYNRITKNKKYIHDSIVNGLRFEIDLRERTNGMGYFKKLPTWIDSEEWKAYENETSITNLEKPSQYGSELE